MRFLCFFRWSVLLFVVGLSVPAFASTLPFNLAPNALIGNEETIIYTDAAGNPTSGVGLFYISSFNNLLAGATPFIQSGATSFSYTQNSGWSETLGNFGLSLDYEITTLPDGSYPPNAGLELEEEVILCPAAGECQSRTLQKGNLSVLQPLVAGPLAPGTGEFLYSEYASMVEVQQFSGGPELLGNYTYSPVPEPSSLLLLATGTLGLLARRGANWPANASLCAMSSRGR